MRPFLRRKCPRSTFHHPSTPPPQLHRAFHDYFVTHLPSTSLHPDSRPASGPSHKLPRDNATPHDSQSDRSPAAFEHPGRVTQTGPGLSREMTVVRIPLKSAKHHYGVSCVRGTRPYNEDAFQAGTVEMPAFAKRAPATLTARSKGGIPGGEAQGADSASGDPQVFYFGVFDGHGGDVCSHFLRDKLHTYVEQTAKTFGMESSLRSAEVLEESQEASGKHVESDQSQDPEELAKTLVQNWRDTVGGYFRRFKPEYFSEEAGGQGRVLPPSVVRSNSRLEEDATAPEGLVPKSSSVERVLTYTFLQADYDFVNAQAPPSAEPTESDSATKSHEEALAAHQQDTLEELGRHGHHSSPPFLGGSTCSVVLVSTPSATPFWHPKSPLTIITAHLGDTRILLCDSATGAAIPITAIHHPSTPVEASRLRRYAATFTTDSFGEERVLGLANTRAFGDLRSKRVGVSAEPDIRILHLAPSSHSFMVLVSDGVTDALSDQEIVDVVKEAKTPDQGARDVVSLATELSEGEKGEADNATAMVVRLGGWERRSEGGGGSLGTKESRDWRKKEAGTGRGRRT